MSEDEIRRTVDELAARVEDLENERDAIKRLPSEVAKLAGSVEVLHDIVIQGFDGSRRTIEVEDQTINKPRSMGNAMYAIQFVLLPLMIAIISAIAIIIHGAS